MDLWIACLPGSGSPTPEPAGPWLAAFGPQPSPLEDGWVLELSGSRRLFGGQACLLRQVEQAAGGHGWPHLGAAPTALAALALARYAATLAAAPTTPQIALDSDWTARIDALPLQHLQAARAHHDVLDASGIRTLGDLRRCPRAALARRTEAALLTALDALYGQAPSAVPGWQPPEAFETQLEMPAATHDAGALTFAAQRLLGHLTGWLRQRQTGVLHWRLGWNSSTPTPALDFRHRAPVQDAALLLKLLHERLQHIRLDAPVDGLWLQTVEVAPIDGQSANLLPGRPAADALPWEALVERLSARLGAARVQTVECQAQWDPGQRQRWRPAAERPAGMGNTPSRGLPSLPGDATALAAAWAPPWRLPHPRPLGTGPDGRPVLDGQPLRRLLGPQRIRTAWWATRVQQEACIAVDAEGRCWWLVREWAGDRPGTSAWHLAGVYA